MKKKVKAHKEKIYKNISIKNIKFLFIIDKACSPEADRELYEKYISYLEFKHDQNRNSCYVWDAILASYKRSVYDFEIQSAGSIKNFMMLDPIKRIELDIKAERHVGSIPISLPSWCIMYLVRTASAIAASSHGLDLSKQPTNYDDYEGYRNHLRKWLKTPTLTNKQAAARLVSLLDLTRRGWNAFDQRQRERIALNLEQLFCYRIIGGMSPNKAYAAIAEDLGLEERALRRHIAQGRKLIHELERFVGPLSGNLFKPGIDFRISAFSQKSEGQSQGTDISADPAIKVGPEKCQKSD